MGGLAFREVTIGRLIFIGHHLIVLQKVTLRLNFILFHRLTLIDKQFEISLLITRADISLRIAMASLDVGWVDLGTCLTSVEA
jgi:hypothetical protein